MSHTHPGTSPSSGSIARDKFSRILAILFFTVFGLYVLLWATLTNLPFQDVPNHATRAYLIKQSLLGAASNGFQFHFDFIPYIFGDLLAAALMCVFSVTVASQVWFVFLFSLFLFSVLFYFRSVLAIERFSQICPLVAFSLLYVGSNWFLLSGYTNFWLSVSLAFLTLAFWEHWLSPSVKNANFGRRYCAYIFSAVFTYLAHLAGFFFVGLILGVSGVIRLVQGRISVSQFLLTVAPLGAITLLHVALGHQAGSSNDDWVTRSIADKFFSAGSMFIRFNLHTDSALSLLFLILAVVLLLAKIQREGQLSRATSDSETFLILLLLGVAFVLLPYGIGPTTEIDIRAIPFITVFFLRFAVGTVPQQSTISPWSLGTAFALAVINLVYLTANFLPADEYLREYRKALSVIPEESIILPVNARPDVERMNTSFHQAELYMTEHRGLVAYVFSRNTSPEQFAYFSYPREIYMPSMHWYQRDQKIDWAEIDRTYSHIIITKPFDRSRIQIGQLEEIYSNSAATVFRLTGKRS